MRAGTTLLIYQTGYDQLLHICQKIVHHREKMVKPLVERILLKHIDMNVPNEELLTHLIAESLLKRIDHRLLKSKNIYVEQFDIPQITLFYSMFEAVPFVPAAHSCANQYLVEVMKDLKVATIFDIGIGNGFQIQKLFDMLKRERSSLKKINIIGLDLNNRNLKDSQKRIKWMEPHLPFSVKFYPMCTMFEDLSEQGYQYIKEIGGDTLIVNASFSLHHTIHELNDDNSRTNLLKKLRSLNPLIFTLIEPSSNHDTEYLPKRLHHGWQHFGNVFGLIDEADIEASHKFIIKEKFFGREVRDVFGVSDYFRTERHEPYDSWLLRLTRAGFRPFDFTNLHVELPSYCDFTVSEGIVRMNYNDLAIVAVFGYTSYN